MPIEIKTRRYFLCLECNEGVFWIEHLFGETPLRGGWGTWYCTECGAGHRGKPADDSGNVHAELTGHKRLWKSVLLKLEPDAGDVYLTVRGMHFTKDGEMPDHAWYEDGARYFYEEGTCPTNYLGRVIEIMQVGKDFESTDPHGIFEYVMSAPLYTDEGRACDNVEERLALFRPPDTGWVLCPMCDMKGTPMPAEDPVVCGNCNSRFLRAENLTTPPPDGWEETVQEEADRLTDCGEDNA